MPNTTVPPSPVGPPTPALRRSWMGVATMGLIVLSVPMLLRFGPAERRPFDDGRLQTMNRDKPTIVLLGDSMLGTRIDDELLDRTSARNCFVFAQPASSSATWYLMMKNFAAAQKPPPQIVIIFYRDRQLTIAAHRTQGDYRKSMEPYMREQEPVIDRLLGVERSTATGVAGAVNAIYPLERTREAAHARLERWALDLVATSRDYEAIRNSARQLFSLDNLRQDSEVDEQKEGNATTLDDEHHDFAANVGQSFLPPILAIAKENGIGLIFYEVKRRPNREGRDQQENEVGAGYDSALRTYLEAHGAFVYDETDDADITVDLYGSGDHIAPKRMKQYTKLFWPKVASLAQTLEERRP